MKLATGKSWQSRVNRNDLILQSLSEGVCIIDGERKIIFANNSAAKLLELNIAELIDKNYDLVFFHRDKTLLESELSVCPIQFALSEGATSHIKTETFLRADATDFLVEYICAPIIENDEIIGVVVTFQDITERRDIETAIDEARNAALEAARIKSAFLANMSHEIRTPLSGIVGTANLLADTDLSAEQRNYVEMLQKSVDSLMNTVNEVLDFSKIEAGKLRLETIDFSLLEVINEVIELFKSSFDLKGLKFKLEINNDIDGMYRGDANRIRQILGNLIGNAVKFTEKGEIKLSIAKSNSFGLRFEIADTGIGISEVQKSKLFHPFTQADVSTTRLFGGTGLGLTICKELVEMMQGEIGFESENRKGSKFWFIIPLIRLPDFDLQATDFADKFEGLRILVAEDNEITRRIILKLLEQIGLGAEIAKNGAEVVKAFSERSFDLILMDCQMPEMDGYTATQTIRSNKSGKKMPKIVALTANAEEIERDKCLQAGMDDFLCKPVTKDDLVKMLRMHFPDENLLSNLDLRGNLIQDSLSKIIDRTALENFLTIESRGEKGFVADILTLYCENTENKLREFDEILANHDLEGIKQLAHGLKGSSANAGVKRLFNLFEELEKHLSSENWGQISRSIAKIRQDFSSIKEKIFESVKYEARKKDK